MRPNTWRNFLDCERVADHVLDREALDALADAIAAWLATVALLEVCE